MNDNFNDPIVGFPKEWKAFFNRHPSWHQVLKKLHQVLETTFIRTPSLSTPAERIVFFMGRLCAEDFNEICLLVCNGYGYGSLKILRGFYERVVTIAYLSENQDEAEQFLNYHHIHRGKLTHHAEKFFGNLDKYISKEEIKEAKKNFDEFKSKFQMTQCKNCNTTRIMHSWSKLDIAAMAKKTKLDKLYFPGYFYPTLQSHATASSIFKRLNSSEGSISFNEKSQPEIADRSLIIAHNLIIQIVDIQNRFFNLDLSVDLEHLVKDFEKLWKEQLKSEV